MAMCCWPCNVPRKRSSASTGRSRCSPDLADAYNNRGNALLELKRPEEALASHDRAIALQPDLAEAHNNRGNALLDLKRPEEALASYDAAIALQPELAEAYNNRGNALKDLQRPEEALVSLDRAIALKPDFAEAYNNRGNVLLALQRPEEALVSLDRAIALQPDLADAYNNRGNALLELKRPEEALASHDRAIALKPDFAEAYNSRTYAETAILPKKAWGTKGFQFWTFLSLLLTKSNCLRILELGSGRSTITLAEYARFRPARFISIETNRRWFNKARFELRMLRVSEEVVHLVDWDSGKTWYDVEQFRATIRELGNFDFAFIDGPNDSDGSSGGIRNSNVALSEIQRCIGEAEVVIVDDVHRLHVF